MSRRHRGEADIYSSTQTPLSATNRSLYPWKNPGTHPNMGHTVAQLVEALRYKPEGRSLMVSLEFFIDIILPAALWKLWSTQPLTEMRTRNISWG
jgi:hypothetical protein